LPGTNAPAYWTPSTIFKILWITLTPGPDVIRLYMSIMYEFSL
jgi:hypothetical protein